MDNKNSKSSMQSNVIKGLKEKDRFYKKTDKRNTVVIFDKSDYF